MINAALNASGICGKNDTIIINNPYARITLGFEKVCHTTGTACNKGSVMAVTVANVSSLSNNSPTIKKPITLTNINSTKNDCTPVVFITLISCSVKIVIAEVKKVCVPNRNDAMTYCIDTSNNATAYCIDTSNNATVDTVDPRNDAIALCVDPRKLVALSTPPDPRSKVKIVKYTITQEADITAITDTIPKESRCLLCCVLFPCIILVIIIYLF